MNVSMTRYILQRSAGISVNITVHKYFKSLTKTSEGLLQRILRVATWKNLFNYMKVTFTNIGNVRSHASYTSHYEQAHPHVRNTPVGL